MSEARTAFLCAGGTGGHLFPAEALANQLAIKGLKPHLLTDGRGMRFASNFPGPVHKISSETLRGKNPVAALKMVLSIGRGYGEAMRLIRQHEPAVVVGFGGYPSLPPMLAAMMAGRPTLIHEQNGVMGKANRLIAKRVDRVAVSFPRPLMTPNGVEVVLTGNPVRAAVMRAAETPYPASDAPLELLVFGGSQGARVLSRTVPAAVARLEEGVRTRLRVTQQVQETDLTSVGEAYAAMGVSAEVAPFFTDLPQRIANAHLVICRAGASTVAELTAIGRPAILVPLKQSREGDQAANGASLAEAGGALLLDEVALEEGSLPPLLNDLLSSGVKRRAMAAKSRAQGRLDAASTLADLAINLATTA